MNEVQNDQRSSRKTLRDAVESPFGNLDQSYVVSDGFFLEEAINEGAIRSEMEYFVPSEHRRDRRKLLLVGNLDLNQDLDQLVRDKTGIEVGVEAGSDSASA